MAGERRGGRSPHSIGGQRPRNTRLNIVLVAVIVAVAVVAAIVLHLGASGFAGSGDGGTGAVARITDGDGNVYEMPLAEDATRTVTTSLGTNVVEVADGRVRVREADCPNQDCVNQGWIGSSDQQIVCLPHKLYVDIVGGSFSGVDVVGR